MLPRFAGAFMAMSLTACTPCNLIECNGGFRLEVTQAGGLPEGTYTLDLEIEDSHHELTCTVDAQVGFAQCTVDEAGDVFTIDAAVESVGDLAQIRVTIVDTSESEGEFLPRRGPDTVAIAIDYLDARVAMEVYTPEYVREDYRGPSECGYCDEVAQPQQMEITVPP